MFLVSRMRTLPRNLSIVCRQVLSVFHEASTALLPATLMSLATVTEALARISEGQFARRGYFLKVLLRNAEDSQRRGLALAPRVIEQISRANEAHAAAAAAQWKVAH